MKKILLVVVVFLLSMISVSEYVLMQKVNSMSIHTSIPPIEESIPRMQEEHHELSFFFVGDALYHDGVYKDGLQQDGTYSFTKNLELIKPYVGRYDLAYYNQESILGGTSMGLSTYPRFNSPQEVGDAFVDAGFNLVGTANNHTMDRGEQAILNSVSYWKQKNNVLMSGTCDSYLCMDQIPVSEKNGISYAFLSYTTSLNGLSVPKGKWYLVNEYSYDRVEKDILKVRDKVDVIIVAMHWGVEYRDYPNEEQKRIANELAHLGVDLVIGTHPHVIQPIEQIGDTIVFYSLGNFISAQEGLDKLVGLAGGVTITKDIVGDTITTKLCNVEAMMTYTYYNKRYRDFKVIPFSQMNDSILNNYQSVEQKKKELIQSYGMNVHFIT